MNRLQYWLFLLLAILFEIGGTSIMKLSQSPDWILGSTSGLVAMFLLIALSYYCLSRAVQGLPVGVAFACWEGLGLALISAVSVLLLGETMTLTRLLALLAILVGVLLVNHGTGHGTGHDKDDSAETSSSLPEARQ